MFNGVYKGKKVLITGNTGFKGSWLTAWLLKLGAKVYGLSKDVPTIPSMFEGLNLNKKITYFEKDDRDLNSVLQIINDVKPDFIFHLAAKNRCIGIIITSDKCYDNVEWIWGYRENDRLGGKDIYSGSKGATELVIKSYYHSFFKHNDNIRVASARAGNVIGGGDWAQDRIVPDCMRAWSNNESVEIRNPNSTRPWQHVLEPLSGYLTIGWKLFESGELNGESFNFGPDTTITHTVKDLVFNLGKFWNLENSFKEGSSSNQNKFSEARLLKLNCDKALFFLKWVPTLDFEQLIKFTGNWYYNYYNNKDMWNLTLFQIDEYEKIAKSKGILWTL
ncbi:CDP-glucose 4,6-dehydratase [subsurface metagenome]